MQTELYHEHAKYYYEHAEFYCEQIKLYHEQANYYYEHIELYHEQAEFYHVQTELYHEQAKHYHEQANYRFVNVWIYVKLNEGGLEFIKTIGAIDMNDLQVKRYEMFIRVSVFGQTHASAFPSSALAGRLFAEVDETIDQLKDYMTAQITSGNSMRQNTSDKTRLRNKLCESLAAMSRTARSIESASGKRDFFELFRVPRTNLNNQILLGTARVSADRAAQFAEEFAKYEMSVDFFEELKNNIELFEKAVSGQNFGKNAKVEATAAIDQAIKRGRTAVRQLDAIMRNKFGKDTSVMAVWKNASHTVRVSRTAAAKETPETAETPTDANADKQLNHEVHEEHEVREE